MRKNKMASVFQIWKCEVCGNLIKPFFLRKCYGRIKKNFRF